MQLVRDRSLVCVHVSAFDVAALVQACCCAVGLVSHAWPLTRPKDILAGFSVPGISATGTVVERCICRTTDSFEKLLPATKNFLDAIVCTSARVTPGQLLTAAQE